MTIGAVIKTANLTKLCLLFLLAFCFIWLGRDLYNTYDLQRNLYRATALITELRICADEKYRLALEYVSAPSEETFHAWMELLRTEQGKQKRPSKSFLQHGEGLSLSDIAAGLKFLDVRERELFDRALSQNELLTRQTEAAIMRAKGLYPADKRGEFMVSGPPQPAEALQWIQEQQLERIPYSILTTCRQLRELLYQDFIRTMDVQRRTLGRILIFATLILLLLILFMIRTILLFKRRVTRPLAIVGKYAEDVASNKNPAPLHLEQDDELSRMYASLEKMKDTLMARITAVEKAQKTAQDNQAKAMQAKIHALNSLQVARKAVKSQDAFLRHITHEIHTPLNAILGMCYLCMQTHLERKQHDYLSQIYKSGNKLLDMFKQLFEFSSVNADNIRAEDKIFAPRELLERMRDTFAPAAREKNLAFILSLSPDLPKTVYGDAARIEEILQILLENAIQYTQEGHVELAATAAAGRDDGSIRLNFSVSDTGPGISKDLQDKLFEPFAVSSVDGAKAGDGHGLGLGLTLARSLATLLGGELTAKSSPDKGTFMSVSLDASLGQARFVMPAVEPQQLVIPAAEEAAAVAPHILMAEDNEINAQIGKELLEQAGVTVSIANNGQEAVDFVQANHVDLVLMDVQMPVLDGIEATRRIRALGFEPEDLPILAMTAHTDEGSRMDGQSVGMNDYLTKPVNPKKLYAALAKWLPQGLPTDPSETDAPAATDSSTSDEAIHIPRFQGRINTAAGLATVGGNEKLYGDLLKRFASHYKNCAADMRNLLAERDYEAAWRLAHAIKGVSANLGIEEVTALVLDMETCLPREVPSEDLLRRFDVAMDETLLQIRNMQGDNASSVTVGSAALPQETKDALMLLLEGLPQRVETDWGGSERTLEEFAPQLSNTPYAKEFADLLDAVNDFDNDAIRATGAKLADLLSQQA